LLPYIKDRLRCGRVRNSEAENYMCMVMDGIKFIKEEEVIL